MRRGLLVDFEVGMGLEVTALLCCVAGFQGKKAEFIVLGFGVVLRADAS